MAAVQKALLALLLFSLYLYVTKGAFVGSDSIGLSVTGEETDEAKIDETFMWSSLFVNREKQRLTRTPAYIKGQEMRSTSLLEKQNQPTIKIY